VSKADPDWTQVMFGVHAMQSPCQLILQDMGQYPDGKYVTMVVGVLATTKPLLSEEARQLNCPHELIVGDLVIRPHGKFASRNFIGFGAGGLLTGEAMYPEEYEHQTLDNGYARLHPNDIRYGLTPEDP
jgi:hypothetical protein